MSLALVRPTDDREWHEWRSRGIGASDAAGIVGNSPFASPISVWLSKVGLAGPTEPTEAQQWGLLLEPVITGEFERRTGLYVRSRQSLATHPEHDWMRATLDGMVADSLDMGVEPLGVFESKTSGDWARTAWDNGVPEHIQVQVMHQLAVTGSKVGWVVALLGGQKLVTFIVERDQAVIDILMELEETFWTKYVLTQTPPPVDGSERTTEAIRDAFAEPSGDFIELPADALELVRLIHAASAEEKAAAERAETARNTMRLLLGDAQIGLYGGDPLVTWKQVTQDRIDSEELRAREPSVAARYTKTTSYRRLLFPKHKEVV